MRQIFINATPNYFALPGYKVNVSFKAQKLMPGKVIDCVCQCFMISSNDIFKKDRTRRIVIARQTAMYLLVNKCGVTKLATGRLFNQDHTTVIHAVRLVSGLIDVDQDYRKIFMAVTELLAANSTLD